MHSDTRWLVTIALVQIVSMLAIIGTTFRTISGADPTFLSLDLRVALLPIQALVLLASAVLLWILLRRSQTRQRAAEDRVRALSRAFSEHVAHKFQHWGLSPAERDVALFTLKGFSLSEIASLRGTTEGTIKAQSNAIYRKAGVRGRNQLTSLFIDEMFSDPSDP